MGGMVSPPQATHTSALTDGLHFRTWRRSWPRVRHPDEPFVPEDELTRVAIAVGGGGMGGAGGAGGMDFAKMMESYARPAAARWIVR